MLKYIYNISALPKWCGGLLMELAYQYFRQIGPIAKVTSYFRRETFSCYTSRLISSESYFSVESMQWSIFWERKQRNHRKGKLAALAFSLRSLLHTEQNYSTESKPFLRIGSIWRFRSSFSKVFAKIMFFIILKIFCWNESIKIVLGFRWPLHHDPLQEEEEGMATQVFIILISHYCSIMILISHCSISFDQSSYYNDFDQSFVSLWFWSVIVSLWFWSVLYSIVILISHRTTYHDFDHSSYYHYYKTLYRHWSIVIICFNKMFHWFSENYSVTALNHLLKGNYNSFDIWIDSQT